MGGRSPHLVSKCPVLERVGNGGVEFARESQMILALGNRFLLEAAECDEQRRAVVRPEAAGCTGPSGHVD